MPQRDPETYAILGAAMRVHSELGRGFLESVYQDAFEVELREQKIPFLRKARIPVFYREVELSSCFVADFICFENVIVELKALTEWSGKESPGLELSQGDWLQARIGAQFRKGSSRLRTNRQLFRRKSGSGIINRCSG